jgi:hypothetical protein
MDSRGDRGLAALPVIKGSRWFGSGHRSLVVRMEVPVPFDAAVAVLYGTAGVEDLVTDEELAGCVAVRLLIEGMPGLEARAARLRELEANSGVRSPRFLDRCRERVGGLLSA